MIEQTIQPPAAMQRARLVALGVGVVGLALCAVGWFLSADQFFRAYLFAYVFWLGMGLGCVALVMVHYLVGGKWGFLIRRVLEAGAMTLPVMAALFVPLLLGMRSLYTWTNREVVAESAVLQSKTAYLNVPFFIARAVIYFAIWIVLALLLRRWSLEQDRTADPDLTRRLRLISKAGLVLYVLSITFASVDWVMSLEPEWYSTIYGMIFITGQGLEALALAIAVTILLADRTPLAQFVNAARLRDLGNLLLTFVMLWAYVAFSQFIIIWSGNLPEEVIWYVHRTTGGWQWIGLFLILFQFFLPFFLLLFRFNKRSPRVLASIAVGIMLVYLVNVFWLVLPAFRQTGLSISWLDVVAPIAIGGIWLGVFLWYLQGKPLLPLHDPRMAEAWGHE